MTRIPLSLLYATTLLGASLSDNLFPNNDVNFDNSLSNYYPSVEGAAANDNSFADASSLGGGQGNWNGGSSKAVASSGSYGGSGFGRSASYAAAGASAEASSDGYAKSSANAEAMSGAYKGSASSGEAVSKGYGGSRGESFVGSGFGNSGSAGASPLSTSYGGNDMSGSLNSRISSGYGGQNLNANFGESGLGGSTLNVNQFSSSQGLGGATQMNDLSQVCANYYNKVNNQGPSSGVSSISSRNSFGIGDKQSAFGSLADPSSQASGYGGTLNFAGSGMGGGFQPQYGEQSASGYSNGGTTSLGGSGLGSDFSGNGYGGRLSYSQADLAGSNAASSKAVESAGRGQGGVYQYSEVNQGQQSNYQASQKHLTISPRKSGHL